MCCAAYEEAGERWRAIGRNESYARRDDEEVAKEKYRPLRSFSLPAKRQMTSPSGLETRIVHNKNETAYWVVKGHDVIVNPDEEYGIELGHSDVVVLTPDFDGMLYRSAHSSSTCLFFFPM
jgi:hypothetical protein